MSTVHIYIRVGLFFCKHRQCEDDNQWGNNPSLLRGHERHLQEHRGRMRRRRLPSRKMSRTGYNRTTECSHIYFVEYSLFSWWSWTKLQVCIRENLAGWEGKVLRLLPRWLQLLPGGPRPGLRTSRHGGERTGDLCAQSLCQARQQSARWGGGPQEHHGHLSRKDGEKVAGVKIVLDSFNSFSSILLPRSLLHMMIWTSSGPGSVKAREVVPAWSHVCWGCLGTMRRTTSNATQSQSWSKPLPVTQ